MTEEVLGAHPFVFEKQLDTDDGQREQFEHRVNVDRYLEQLHRRCFADHQKHEQHGGEQIQRVEVGRVDEQIERYGLFAVRMTVELIVVLSFLELKSQKVG